MHLATGARRGVGFSRGHASCYDCHAMRVVSLLGLLSLCALAWPSSSRAESAAIEQIIREGLAHNLAGDYAAADRSWLRLRELAPESPAAPAYELTTLFARMSFRNDDRGFDPEIQSRVDRVARLAEGRLARDPADAETLYYQGYARFQRARLHAMRDELYAGGAVGEEARKSLERALEIRPGLTRAKLPLGMYLYYASALPGALRLMSFLWFVPKGSAEQGLALLRELQAGEGVLADEAAWVLSDVYEDFMPERREQGLALIRGLAARYPRNDLFRMQELFILARMGRHAEAQAAAAALVQGLAGRPEQERLRSVARVWEARAAIEQGDPASARAALSALREDRGDRPPWLEAFVTLAEGQLADAGGDRAGARARCEAVVALQPPRRASHATRLAEGYLERPFQVGVAAAD